MHSVLSSKALSSLRHNRGVPQMQCESDLVDKLCEWWDGREMEDTNQMVELAQMINFEELPQDRLRILLVQGGMLHSVSPRRVSRADRGRFVTIFESIAFNM